MQLFRDFKRAKYVFLITSIYIYVISLIVVFLLNLKNKKSFSRYLVTSMNKLLFQSLIVSVVCVNVHGDFYEDSIEFTVYNSL